MQMPRVSRWTAADPEPLAEESENAVAHPKMTARYISLVVHTDTLYYTVAN